MKHIFSLLLVYFLLLFASSSCVRYSSDQSHYLYQQLSKQLGSGFQQNYKGKDFISLQTLNFQDSHIHGYVRYLDSVLYFEREQDGDQKVYSTQLFVITGADATSFQLLTGTLWTKDSKHVYRQAQLISGAKSSSFIVLDSHYARDDHRVFIGRQEILGADTGTFVPLPKQKKIQHSYAKDKNFFYFEQDPQIKGFDYATIRVLPECDERFLLDKNALYMIQGRNSSGTITQTYTGFDMASLKIADCAFSIVKDKNGRYELQKTGGWKVREK